MRLCPVVGDSSPVAVSTIDMARLQASIVKGIGPTKLTENSNLDTFSAVTPKGVVAAPRPASHPGPKGAPVIAAAAITLERGAGTTIADLAPPDPDEK